MANKKVNEQLVSQVVENTMQGIATKINIFAGNENSDVEVQEFTTGEILQKKSYELLNPVGARSTLTTSDSVVIKSIELINKAKYGRELTELVICKEMAKLNNEDTLSGMGFKSITEFGLAVFDFAPVTTRQYVRIGKLFVDDSYNLIGALPFKNKGQLIELLTMCDNDEIVQVVQGVENGYFTGTESQKELRKKVKSYKNSIIEIGISELPESATIISSDIDAGTVRLAKVYNTELYKDDKAIEEKKLEKKAENKSEKKAESKPEKKVETKPEKEASLIPDNEEVEKESALLLDNPDNTKEFMINIAENVSTLDSAFMMATIGIGSAAVKDIKQMFSDLYVALREYSDILN